MKRACLICVKTLEGEKIDTCPEHGQLPSSVLWLAEECYKMQKPLQKQLSKEELESAKKWAKKELKRLGYE